MSKIINFLDLDDEVNEAFLTGKTPLLYDLSITDRVCSYYSYQMNAILLDAKTLILKQRYQELEAILEIGRISLVNAMKYGKLLVIRLGKSAPDFRNILNDDNLHSILRNESDNGDNKEEELKYYFPKEVLLEGGR